MRIILRQLARGLMLAAFTLALVSTSGCASDDGASRREPRDDPPRDWNQQPGFTPFSS
jgi:hypothetical protein